MTMATTAGQGTQRAVSSADGISVGSVSNALGWRRASVSRQPPMADFFGLSRRGFELSAVGLRRATQGLNRPVLPKALGQPQRRLAEVLPKHLAKASRGGTANLEQRLLQRLSFGWNLVMQDEIESMGISAYVDRQLDPQSLDDGGLEDALAQAFPSLAMSPAQRLVTYFDNEQEAFYEFVLARIYRALYSPRQLYERLVDLWTDHFNIYLFSDYGLWLKPTDDLEVIRPHALGKFPDLLRASAHSPAMLDYLTNDSNVRQHPNENYARELMELHSLGVDGGYTEADVKEVARCLTGWTFLSEPEAGFQWGRFAFDGQQHDMESKAVLGQHIAAGGGIEDGERVLDILASHASTARFISRKMLRHFWGYEPDERSVDKVAQLYVDHGGDIPTMVEGVFRWYRMTRATPKVKRPTMMVTSTLRALFAQADAPLILLATLFAAGHLPFNWGPPNGYPDSAGYWSGYLLPRFDFASLFLLVEEYGVTVDLPFLDPSEEPAQLRAILDLLLLGGTSSETTGQAVESYLRSRPASRQTLAEAIGLMVASPEFQQF